jgi:hypothetical protein
MIKSGNNELIKKQSLFFLDRLLPFFAAKAALKEAKAELS